MCRPDPFRTLSGVTDIAASSPVPCMIAQILTHQDQLFNAIGILGATGFENPAALDHRMWYSAFTQARMLCCTFQVRVNLRSDAAQPLPGLLHHPGARIQGINLCFFAEARHVCFVCKCPPNGDTPYWSQWCQLVSPLHCRRALSRAPRRASGRPSSMAPGTCRCPSWSPAW